MVEYESLDDARAAVEAKAVDVGGTVLPYPVPPTVTIQYHNIMDGQFPPTWQEHKFIQVPNGKWIIELGTIKGASGS
jgi:hypothetical protein